MLRLYSFIIPAFCVMTAMSQPAVQQAQQRQLADERAQEQRAQERAQQLSRQTEQQRQAQVDEVRHIDRQQAEQQHQQAEQRKEALALAQQQYLAQQAAQQQAAAIQRIEDQNQSQPAPQVQTLPGQPAGSPPRQQIQPIAAQRWSFKNMNRYDKIGLAALGVLLAALAVAAGIIPLRQ